MAKAKDKAKKSGPDDPILVEAQDALKRAQDAESNNRSNWLDDMRFARLGEQWPEGIRNQRELQFRPCLTINRLPSFIRQVTNNARQNKPAIKCHPVGDGADQATARILNGLIKNIEVSSNADIAYDTALDHAVTGGFGYIRVTTDYAHDDSFDQDIRIERVANPLTVYGDPDSMGADSADWNVALITDMWRKEDFKRRWPNATETDFAADDTQKDLNWFEGDNIRVAEYWKREEVERNLLQLSNGIVIAEDDYLEKVDLFDSIGAEIADERKTKSYKVTQYIVSGAEVLETNEWQGRYIPIVPVYGDEVIIEGEKHYLSLVRFAKDPQRNLNYWRTAATELVALAPKAPFVGAKGAFSGDPNWGSANTVNHAYLEYDPIEGAAPPQRQPFAGVPAGAMQEAMNSGDDMKSIMGLFDASLGARSNETSGIAINQRKRQGDTSTFNFLDNQSRALRHVGRICVDLIPHVYNKARIIRTIDEDGTTKEVQINGQDQQQAAVGPNGGQNPQAPGGQPGAAPMPAMQPQGPQPMPMQGGAMPPSQDAQDFDEGMARIFDLTAGKYDVTVETGPNYETRREEAADQIMGFLKVVPMAAPLMGDLVAKNMDWPGADEISRRLKIMLPPQLQGKNPALMQAHQQMQQMDQHAKEAVHVLQGQLQQVQQQAGHMVGQAKQQAQDAIQALEQQLAKLQLQLQDKELDGKVNVAKTNIDGYNAETNRLKVMGTTVTPELVQQLAAQTVQQMFAQPEPAEGGEQGQEMPEEQGPTPEQMQAQADQQRSEAIMHGLGILGQQMQQLTQLIGAPRRLVRDEQGRPSHAVVDMPPPTAPPQAPPEQQQAPQGAFSLPEQGPAQ